MYNVEKNQGLTQMNKSILKIVTFCVLLLLCQFTVAASSLEKVQPSIDRLIKNCDPNINVGIMVKSLNTGKIIYQKNADQLFMPASVLKIFPAAAALTSLGPNYVFQTKVLAQDVAVNQGTLNNDLYFYFDGDPTLTQQDIDNLITTVAQFGIHTINGNIYIDDTVFDQEVSGPGWMWDERNFCYAAPTSAIIIDKNCFSLQITTPQKPNKPATLTSNNYEKFISIINQVTSKQPGNGSCPFNLHATSDNVYRVNGCIAPNKTIGLSVAIRNVRLYTKNMLLEKLREHNIRLLGEIKFKNTPTDTLLYALAEHKSKPLSELLKTMLKKSDNSIADAVFKKIGYNYFHKTSTWHSSAQAIANILASKTGISFKKMKIVDGSGLSRYSLVSPAQLVAVLRYAYTDKNINQAFTSSLSIAGADGTLKYRMPNLKNRVYAKTGNMEGISSLVGYIKTAHQGNLAFAITVNSFLNNNIKYRQLQDKICTILANM
ncbi:MAG: hypothetical protein ACD_21C00228G0007 [uncultured bacterium]|nr:MAG: hypothetical protein ACD_21C00228G0007 [uncultured bacterium]